MKKVIQIGMLGVPDQEVVWVGTYRPRISSEHLLRLYRLKRETKKPVTKLIDEALEHYFMRIGEGGERHEKRM